MANKPKFNGSDWHLKRGFEIQKMIDAAEDEDEFIDKLEPQDKNLYKIYLDNKSLALNEYETETAEMDEAEYDNYLSKLLPDNREMLRYESKKAEEARKAKEEADSARVPTPAKVDAIVEKQKQLNAYLADPNVDQRHPGVSFLDRWNIKNLVDRPRWAESVRRSLPAGYTVTEAGDNVLIQGPNDATPKVLDPSKFEWEDITDLITDIGGGIAEGFTTAGGAVGGAAVANVPGAIAGGIGAGAATGGGISALKQALAKKLGYIDDIDASEVGKDAAFSGAFSLVPGSKTVTPGMKKWLAGTTVKGLDDSLKPVAVARGMKGVDEVLYPLAEQRKEAQTALLSAVSGVPKRALELGKKHIKWIDDVDLAVKSGSDPIHQKVKELRTGLKDTLKQAQDFTHARKVKELNESNRVFDLDPYYAEIKTELKNLKKPYMRKNPETEKMVFKRGLAESEDLAKIDALRGIKKSYDKRKQTYGGTKIPLREADEIRATLYKRTKDLSRDGAASDKVRVVDETRKKIADDLELASEGYRKQNARYANLKQLEDDLDSQSLLGTDLDDVKARLHADKADFEIPKNYTLAEAKARENLKNQKPEVRRTLREIDQKKEQLELYKKIDDENIPKKEANKLKAQLVKKQKRSGPGQFEDTAEKIQAAQYWLPRDKDAPLKGESRKGWATKATMGAVAAGLGASQAGPLGIFAGLAPYAATSPTAMKLGFRMSNKIDAMKDSPLGLAARGVQLGRLGTGSIYDELREKGE